MSDKQGECPSYAHPPIWEVVFGMQFAPLVELLAPHLGHYWDQIVKDYPKLAEQPPIGRAIESFEEQQPSVPTVQIVGKPGLPRCWFMDPDGCNLVQVQRDRFLYNWRKMSPEDEYPRYPTLKQRFLDHWAVFRDFLDAADLPVPGVDQCELTYVNHIMKPPEWRTMADFGDLFSFLEWAPREKFLPVPEDAAIAVRYLLPEKQGRLYAEVAPAKRNMDMADIIRFTITARGRPKAGTSDANVSEWFDLAHEWITRGFVDMTGPSTDTLWGREG